MHDDSMTSTSPRDAGATDAARHHGWLPTGAAFLATAAVLVLSFEGLRHVASFAAPIFLALTLVLTVDPVRRALVRAGAPMWLATVAMLAMLYGVLLVVIAGIALALSQLVRVLPTYQEQFGERYQQLVDLVEKTGLDVGALEDSVRTVDPGNVMPVLQGVLGGVGSFSASVIFLVLGVAFLTMDLSHAAVRLQMIGTHRPDLAQSLRDFSQRIGRYWAVSTIFGFAQAVLDVILLYFLDVPLPLVWGMLALLTAYIPNVGFVLGLVPPALLALLAGGFVPMLGVIVGYMLINFVTHTLIMPKYLGEAVGLNVTATFVSLIFWSVVIGPLGALLAVPLTLFAKAVLIDADPRSRWLATFITSEPAQEPAQESAQEPAQESALETQAEAP